MKPMATSEQRFEVYYYKWRSRRAIKKQKLETKRDKRKIRRTKKLTLKSYK